MLNLAALDAGYAPEARVLFAAFTTPATQTRKRVINRFVRQLKAAGIWDACDAIYVLAAHNSQASKLNWKTPTETALAETATVTFVADRGWSGNGTSGVLTGPTNFTALTKYTRNDAHIACWTSPANGVFLCGCSASDSGLSPNTSGQAVRGKINSSAGSTSGQYTNASPIAAMYMINRANSATREQFKDGVQQSTVADTSNAVLAVPLTICASSGNFSTSQISFVTIGASLASMALAHNAAFVEYAKAVRLI